MVSCKFKASMVWLMIHESILVQETTHDTATIRVWEEALVAQHMEVSHK